MAYNDWRGDAPAIEQVDTITIGGVPAPGDTVRVTAPTGGTRYVEYTLGALDDAASTASALYDLIAASTIPELSQDITFSYDPDNAPEDIVATASEAGKPFSIAVSKTGTVTITKTATTANSGPSDAAVAANWSLGTTPGATDTLRFRQGASCLYNLGSVTIAAFEHWNTFTNTIGLPYRNGGTQGDGGYVEYRTRFLTLNTTGSIKVGLGDGSGSGQLNLGIIAASSPIIYKTGQRAEDTSPSVEFITTGNPTRIEVIDGDVGICATGAGGTPTVGTLAISNTARVTIGATAIITAMDHDGGTAENYGTCTTLNQTAGQYAQKDGTLGTANLTGTAYIRLQHTGTVTAVTATGQGPGQAPTVDCRDNQRARTFTDCTFKGGAAFLDTNNTVTRTNAMQMDKSSFQVSEFTGAVTIVA